MIQHSHDTITMPRSEVDRIRQLESEVHSLGLDVRGTGGSTDKASLYTLVDILEDRVTRAEDEVRELRREMHKKDMQRLSDLSDARNREFGFLVGAILFASVVLGQLFPR